MTIPPYISDCNQNRSLWTTFHLYETVDLGDLLNVSKVSVFLPLLHFVEPKTSLTTYMCVFCSVHNRGPTEI